MPNTTTSPLVVEIEKILLTEKEGLHVEQITERIILSGLLKGVDRADAVKKINAVLSRKAKSKNSAIIHVKNKKGGNKRGCYKIKPIEKRTSRTAEPITPSKSKIKALFPQIPEITSTMLGKAGEFAVVSKLLLNGYNANIMTVDDGIDIIASQGQNVYFVQVKTSSVDLSLRCKFSVKKSAFQRGHLLDVRYILVARYGENKMLYIRLTEDKINELLHKGLVTAEKNAINISIRFDGDNAIVYKGKEGEALNYYTNNFEL